MKKVIIGMFFFLWGSSIFAQQNQIPLQGTYNFRDIGGYTTKDHHKIKQGKIYRSATLTGLTSEDTLLLTTLNIAKVIDFRGSKEIAFGPDLLPTNVEHIACDAGSENDTPDDWADLAKSMKEKTIVASDSGAINYYRNISSFGDRYRPMFSALLTLPNDSALVIHCVGGKDRTGIGAALIEYVLGIDEKQIIADYILTNKYREEYNREIALILVKKYGVDPKIAATYGLAKPQFLQAAFDEIKQKYASLDLFVQKELKLDASQITTLKLLYLE